MQTEIIKTDTSHLDWPTDVAKKPIVSGDYCISYNKRYGCLVYGYVYNSGVKKESSYSISNILKERYYGFISMFQVRRFGNAFKLVKDVLIGGVHGIEVFVVSDVAIPKEAVDILDDKLNRYLQKYGKPEDYERLGL